MDSTVEDFDNLLPVLNGLEWWLIHPNVRELANKSISINNREIEFPELLEFKDEWKFDWFIKFQTNQIEMSYWWRIRLISVDIINVKKKNGELIKFDPISKTPEEEFYLSRLYLIKIEYYKRELVIYYEK